VYKRCRYNRVLPYIRNGAQNITFCYTNLILFCSARRELEKPKNREAGCIRPYECNPRVLFTKQGDRSRHPVPTVVTDVRGSSQFTKANAGTCGYLKLPQDRFVQRPSHFVIQLFVATKTKLLTALLNKLQVKRIGRDEREMRRTRTINLLQNYTRYL
jgi:hypothetical protein